MLPKTVQRKLLEREYVFRGNTKEQFERRIGEVGYYCGGWDYDDNPLTSFSVNPAIAIFYSRDRAKEFNETARLFSIKAGKYLRNMRRGVEQWEIEVMGKILPEDIIIIKNVDDLLSKFHEENPDTDVIRELCERYYPF